MTGSARDACQGKDAFTTHARASRARRAISRHKDAAVQVYHCPHCHRYHVGAPAVVKSKRRPRVALDDSDE